MNESYYSRKKSKADNKRKYTYLMNTEPETLRLTKQGDIDAFSKIFSPHEKGLKSYLYRLLTDRDDVNDFYQNNFLKAFENILSFKGNTNQFKAGFLQ